MRISSREQEVLFYISKAYSTDEIARILHVSPHTVTSHRKNLLVKFGERNAAGLVRAAFESGHLQRLLNGHFHDD